MRVHSAVVVLASLFVLGCPTKQPETDPCLRLVCPADTICQAGACIPGHTWGGGNTVKKDGGQSTDGGAGSQTDGGSQTDAGATTDAGWEPDGGGHADAGWEPDGGGNMDAGWQLDGGGHGDAGWKPDGGGHGDAGWKPDGGGHGDAGWKPDGGTQTDAGWEPDAGGPPDAGPSPASLQIEAVRAAAPAMGLAMPIAGATVTYAKPLVGSDPEGFFLQADRTGPALFVVTGSTLPIPPVAGDKVDLTVNEVQVVAGQTRVTQFSGYSKLSSGNPRWPLVQDVSGALDLVSNLGSYESELVTVSGTLAGPFYPAGNGHAGADLNTAAVAGNPNLELRVPLAVRDAIDATPGCALTVIATPLWRYADKAQVSAWTPSELTVSSCPAPRVLSAYSVGETQVELTFDRNLLASSVTPSRFTISGLTVTAATATDNVVRLTTSWQVGLQAYTVVVSSAVQDRRGSGVDPAANSAAFSGYRIFTGALVINEVDYDNVGTDSAEFIELLNLGAPVSLSGVSLILVTGDSGNAYATIPLDGAGTLGTMEYLVVASPGVSVPATAKLILFDRQNDNLQNGSPDAIVLTANNGVQIVDSLSYEGETVWNKSTGPISVLEGFTSTLSLADTNSSTGSLARLPNGSDTQENGVDFAFTSTLTPGAPNP